MVATVVEDVAMRGLSVPLFLLRVLWGNLKSESLPVSVYLFSPPAYSIFKCLDGDFSPQDCPYSHTSEDAATKLPLIKGSHSETGKKSSAQIP